MTTPNTDKATSGNLLKLDIRPDQSHELQYVATGIPCAVVCWNGSGTKAVAEMIMRAVNEHAALQAVAEAAKAWHELHNRNCGHPDYAANDDCFAKMTTALHALKEVAS